MNFKFSLINTFYLIFLFSNFNKNILAKTTLSYPLKCRAPDICFISSYFNYGTSSISDYKCGRASRVGHKGIDFRVASRDLLNKNIQVIAAAAGKVISIRNNIKDNKTIADIKEANRLKVECGNRVAIEHKDNLVTDYCHMKKDIKVKVGQFVKAGSVLGYMGFSGNTQMPHLHFSVMKARKVIDPFTSKGVTERCGMNSAGLWDQQALNKMPYKETNFIDVGFSNAMPSIQEVGLGQHRLMNIKKNNSNAFVFWGVYMGAKIGDIVKIDLKNMYGKTSVSCNEKLKKANVIKINNCGFKIRNGKTKRPIGEYTGYFSVTRNGIKIIKKQKRARLL